jgi:hypothetical protein
MKKKDKKYIKKLERWIEKRKEDDNYSLEQFDKLIIYLSSGGLVLTSGILSNIIKVTISINTCLIKDSWILFTLALITNLISQLSSHYANKTEIEISRKEISFIKHDRETVIPKILKRKKSIFDSVTRILNLISFICFIVGVIVFLIFLNKNF